MDSLQEHLGKKERIYKSPSLASAGNPGITERFRFKARDLLGLVKRKTEAHLDSDTETLNWFGEINIVPKNTPQYDRLSIVKKDRFREIAYEQEKAKEELENLGALELYNSAKDVASQDNIRISTAKLLERKIDAWQRLRYDWDSEGDITKKLGNIRKKRMEGARQKTIDELRARATDRTITIGYLESVIDFEDRMAKLLEGDWNGQRARDRIIKVAEEGFNEGPSFSVREFNEVQPGYKIVHGFPFSFNNCLQNNEVIGHDYWTKIRRGQIDATEVWQDFLKYVVGERPTISCCSISNTDSQNSLYHQVGVVLDGGDIYMAEPRDSGSIAVSNNLRVMHHIRTPLITSEDVAREIYDSLRGNAGTYHNEIIVGNPVVGGLYFARPSETKGVQIEGKTIVDLQLAADELAVPLYEFKRGKGFVEY